MTIHPDVVFPENNFEKLQFNLDCIVIKKPLLQSVAALPEPSSLFRAWVDDFVFAEHLGAEQQLVHQEGRHERKIYRDRYQLVPTYSPIQPNKADRHQTPRILWQWILQTFS